MTNANMIVEDKIAHSREGLDRSTGEGRGEPGGVLVKPMCHSPHRLGVAGTVDKLLFRGAG